MAVPEDVDAWLDERAETLGITREELLRELLSAHRAVATADGDPADPDPAPAAIDRQVDALEEEFGAQLDEVRRRLVQVKRAVDGRAPADHDHEAFETLQALDGQLDGLEGRLDEQADRIDSLDNRATELESEVEALDATVGDLRETSEVTTDGLADVEEKLTRVAQVVVSLRDGGSATDAWPDDRLVTIKRLAAREGYGYAECEACGGTVYLTVLPEAACPHCDAPFHDVVERGAIRNRPTLVGEEVADE